MQVTRSTTEKVTIEGADNHDTIIVLLEYLGDKAGRITLTEGGQVNTAYWGSMITDLVTFFTQTMQLDYLLNSFDRFGTLFRKISPDFIVSYLTAEIGMRVDTGVLDAEEGVRLTSLLTQLHTVSEINGLYVMGNDVLTALYGPGWTTSKAPSFQGHHPLYKALESRIAVAREALSS